jgi:hypothetical protein
VIEPRRDVDLDAVRAAYELIGGVVTVLDVSDDDSSRTTAVDQVWGSVPALLREVKHLREDIEQLRSELHSMLEAALDAADKVITDATRQDH